MRAFRAASPNLPSWIFFATLVAKQIWLSAQISPNASLTGWVVLAVSTGGFLLGASWIARAFQGRRQVVALIALDLVLTVVAYGDLLHFRMFGSLPSASSLAFAWQLRDVQGSLFSLMRARDAWLFLDVAVLAAFLARPDAHRFERVRPRLGAALLAAGALASIAVAIASPRTRDRYYGNAYLASHLGLFNYHLWDLANQGRRLFATAAVDREVVERVAARISAGWGRGAGSPLPGAGAGLDVIVLQVEALQGFAAGLVVDGQPITPRLDELARESLRFPNYFHQAATGRTSDAQFLANCSLGVSPAGAVAFLYAGNEFRCLPSVLADRGYETAFFHPYDPDFWNRAAFNPKQGFARSASERDYVIDETIGLGLSDRSFFRQTVAMLQDLPRPYYAFLITLTSHGPFDFPELPRRLRLGRLEGTEVGAYLHAVHYTDEAIGAFIDDLRERGLLDRAILVVYGDHDAAVRRNSNVEDLLPIPAGDELAWVAEERRVPLLVRLPHGRHAREVSTYGGQIDLAPTLAGLLGIPLEGLSFLGHDLLARGRPERVAFPDGMVLGPDRLALGPAGRGPRCLGREGPLPPGACADLEAAAEEDREIAAAILELDLIPELERAWAEVRLGER
ncbi:MAG TPA: LTA synthase family protein [Vulgatibacter sp.]|nr:LTA synthase family protein [Vulgatibacter sp.]